MVSVHRIPGGGDAAEKCEAQESRSCGSNFRTTLGPCKSDASTSAGSPVGSVASPRLPIEAISSSREQPDVYADDTNSGHASSCDKEVVYTEAVIHNVHSEKEVQAIGLATFCHRVQGSKFELPKRYSDLQPVGHGTSGIVCSAQDVENNERIAIKKIENVFEDIGFARRTLRELRILRHMQHENIIDVRSIFLPGSKDFFGDVYVVSELMETDLASILKSSQPITDDHRQFFLYQILRGMKYVHSAEVIHRDLKPRNLLVDANCDLKICDFGLARISSSDEEFQMCPMTQYVCTRWYRAPEVLCAWTDYTKAIDVWSIGCISAEMFGLGRKPFFQGHNTQHQLQLIISCLGTPGNEELRKIPNGKCRKFIKSLPLSEGKPFGGIFGEASPATVDFLQRTLQFDPDKRATVGQALEHAYLSDLHCPEDEPTRSPLDTSDFEFERRKLDIEALRNELFLEVMHYYPDKRELYLKEQASLGHTYNIGQYSLLALGGSQYSSDDEGPRLIIDEMPSD